MFVKRLNPFLIFIFLGSLLVHTVANPDIWFHLSWGRQIWSLKTVYAPELTLISQTGAANFYWLFQLISFSIVKAAGFVGLALFFGLLWFLIFYFWTTVASIDLSKPLSSLLALLAIVIFQIRFQERPEVFSYLFLILDIYIFLNWQNRYSLAKVYALTGLIQILWCNCHGFFVLGPIVASVWAASIWVRENEAKKVWPWAFLPLFLIFVSLISPFGWQNWKGVFDQWSFLQISAEALRETNSPLSFGFSLWNLDLFWIFWVSVLLFTLKRLKTFREDFFGLGLSLMGLYLSATVVRHVPFIVLMSAPLLRNVRLPQVSALRWATPVTVGSLIFWVVTQGYFGSLYQPYKFGLGTSELAFPVQLKNFLSANKLPEKTLWFSDGTYGSYLEYWFPQFKFYGDSRYAGREALEYIGATTDPTIFNGLDQHTHFDFVALDLGHSAKLVASLLKNPLWTLTYSDLHTALFAKNGTPQARTRNDSQIFQGEDLSERISGYEAIQWTVALAESDQVSALVGFLNQLKGATAIPSPVLEISLRYLRLHPDGSLVSAITSLRPKMLALSPQAALVVDQKLMSLRQGTFWY